MGGVRLVEFFKTFLDGSQRYRLKQLLNLRYRRMQYILYRLLLGSNLQRLARCCQTDKEGTHFYTQYYEKFFGPLRRRSLNLLEIGIGGFEDPQGGGGSLRMWRTYFPKAHIYGIDIHDKTFHDEPRIKTFMGSQADSDLLAEVVKTMKTIDIIIDDGSHRSEHVLYTFNYLFPHLSPNGIYVIEDTQTSYWPDYGGSRDEFNRTDTTMGFLKSLVDGLNHVEMRAEERTPLPFEDSIVGMHFFHNIVFIQKGVNEGRG